jgi:hypothetical protein
LIGLVGESDAEAIAVIESACLVRDDLVASFARRFAVPRKKEAS